MKIVFNLYQTGLGNNGGSRTLLKCGELLSCLGNDVIMFSNIISKFTWGKINGVKHIYGEVAPDCDVMVATGVKSVSHVLKSNAHKKFYYIRGFETWQASQEDLIKSYKKLNCIVNSEWLQRKLAENGIRSDLIYQGLDFENFFKIDIPRTIDMGALFSLRHKTKRHDDAIEVANRLGVSLKMLNKHVNCVNDNDLNLWYNKIKVWFAPTELEGLHNPPMEASLAGCPLVCTDHKCNGMNDYAIHEKTALVYPARKLSIARKYVDMLLKDKSLREKLNTNMISLLKTKIGSRKDNMKKMVKIFSR